MEAGRINFTEPEPTLRARLRMRWLFAKHDANRRLENALCDVARRLPRKLRYWVIVTAAGAATDSYPGEVTALEMMRSIDPDAAGPPPDSGGDEISADALAAAELLYDNRLGWGDGRAPYAPREFWAALGMALGRDVSWVEATAATAEDGESELRAARELLDGLPTADRTGPAWELSHGHAREPIR